MEPALQRGRAAARLAGKGLWDPAHCGAGPDQDVPLKLWVRSDPPGIDTASLAGEWVKIQNLGTVAVPLAHWWLRDSMLRRYTFPAGAVVQPGRSDDGLRGAAGRTTEESFHWGLNLADLREREATRNMGDGGYLFDPQGDLRAAMIYPCVVASAAIPTRAPSRSTSTRAAPSTCACATSPTARSTSTATSLRSRARPTRSKRAR